MPVRVDCEVEGYEKCWVEFRDSRWMFGDRVKILNASTDIDGLKLILDYITDWNLLDVNGKKVKFDPDAGVEQLYGCDDTRLIPWIVVSWFTARRLVVDVPLE